MLEINVSQFGNLEQDDYYDPANHKREDPLPRWYMELDNDLYIWQWQEPKKSKENSELAAICHRLNNIQDQPYNFTKQNVFDARRERDEDRIMPVVYQPATDSEELLKRSALR